MTPHDLNPDTGSPAARTFSQTADSATVPAVSPAVSWPAAAVIGFNLILLLAWVVLKDRRHDSGPGVSGEK